MYGGRGKQGVRRTVSSLVRCKLSISSTLSLTLVSTSSKPSSSTTSRAARSNNKESGVTSWLICTAHQLSEYSPRRVAKRRERGFYPNGLTSMAIMFSLSSSVMGVLVVRAGNVVVNMTHSPSRKSGRVIICRHRY